MGQPTAAFRKLTSLVQGHFDHLNRLIINYQFYNSTPPVIIQARNAMVTASEMRSLILDSP